MKIRIITLVIVLVIINSCSVTSKIVDRPSLRYSLMPEYVDLDSLIKIDIDTNEILDSSYKDFVSIPLDSGIVIMNTDTVEIPGGVLISDRKAVMYLFYKSAYERYNIEMKYMKRYFQDYCNKYRAIERIYQDEIEHLKKERERSWLEQNLGYIGYIGGVLTVIMLFYVIR